MADKRITDLPLILSGDITSTDVLPIVDVAADITNKIEINQLKSYILNGVNDYYVTGGTYSNGTITLSRQNGFVSISGLYTGATNLNPLYIVPSGETVVVQENEQYLIYGDLTIDGGVLINYGQVIILDGNLNIVGGEFNDFGQLLFINTEGSTLITYSQLDSAINTSGLISNKSYIIYDFQTIYDQPDFDFFGNPKNIVTTNVGSFEPLLIRAVSENEISQEANSLIYPNDLIKYDWTWNVTEVMGEPAKGRIIERIDEFNNRTDYDHRTVLFKRYETSLGSGVFTELNDNGNPSQEFKTFQTDTDNYSNNNFISNYANLNIVKPFLLSNNIFGLNSEQNDLVGVFTNNTMSDYFRYNISNTEIDKIDFTTATHVYGTYNCTLFENAGGNKVLSFFDAGNVLTITNINL